MIPSGIYTDLGTKQLREMLFSQTLVTGLFCLENRKEIFEGVHRSFKIVVLTFAKGGTTPEFPSAFMRLDVQELQRFPSNDSLRISVDMVRKLSPDSLGIVEFANNYDLSIAKKLSKYPLLGEKMNGNWNISLQSEFHMTNDSYLFHKDRQKGMLPLYEGKMIHQFNHLFEKPRYWIAEKEGRTALLGRQEDLGQKLDYQDYRLGFRKIASNTNARTMISTLIPPNFHAENFQSVRTYDNKGNRQIDYDVMFYLCGVWNSFVLDYLLRMRVTANVNFFYVYQLPIPRLTKNDRYFNDIVQHTAKLICTTPEFDELAQEVGLGSYQQGVTSETKRAKLRAEIDGMVAHLYGLTEEEFAYILTTFPLVPEAVKQAALEAYHNFAFVPQVA